MKKRTTKSSEHPEPLTTARLCEIWEKIRCDPDALRALNRLDKAGFPISHLHPTDATLKQATWADYIAALPLVPNKPSSRRIHNKISYRKYWPLVRELRTLATTQNMPFVEVTILGRKDYPGSETGTLRGDLLKVASMLEHVLSWDYMVRYLNPRNSLIAELRWTIRKRTGKPRDREINVLIDAAFRAAGRREGCYIDPTTLDRMEKREKESRVKAYRRIRSLLSPSAPSL
jgi:hypothetical protein